MSIKTLTTEQYEILKKNMKSTEEDVTKNKGRLEQLHETAKNTFKVETVSELSDLKKELEDKLDMQKTKKKKQMEKLCNIVPEDVLLELDVDSEY